MRVVVHVSASNTVRRRAEQIARIPAFSGFGGFYRFGNQLSYCTYVKFKIQSNYLQMLIYN